MDLGCGNPFMSRHLADCFQRYTLRKRNRCRERMSRYVHRQVERQPGEFGDMAQRHVHRPVVAFDRKDLVVRQM